MTAALICTALSLNALAHASPPTCRSQCGKHRAQSVSSGVLVRAPLLTPRSSFQVASLESLDDAGIAGTRSQRSPGLAWIVLQSPPRDWTEGQPITLSVGLGPSNPRYRGVRGSRPLMDAPPQSVTSATAATGWTRPLGLRLSIRW
jgi:hypothetical protein